MAEKEKKIIFPAFFLPAFIAGPFGVFFLLQFPNFPGFLHLISACTQKRPWTARDSLPSFTSAPLLVVDRKTLCFIPAN